MTTKQPVRRVNPRTNSQSPVQNRHGGQYDSSYSQEYAQRDNVLRSLKGSSNRPISAKGTWNNTSASHELSRARANNLTGTFTTTTAPKPHYHLSNNGPSLRPPSPTGNTGTIVNRPGMFIHQVGEDRAIPVQRPDGKPSIRRPAKEAYLDMYSGAGVQAPGAPASQGGRLSSAARNRYMSPNPTPQNQGGGYTSVQMSQQGQAQMTVPVSAGTLQAMLASKKAGIKTQSGTPGNMQMTRAMPSRAMPLQHRDSAAGNYRNEVAGLEMDLQERLQRLEDQFGADASRDQRMEVFSDVFESVIAKSKLYGGLLSVIKNEYDILVGRYGHGHLLEGGASGESLHSGDGDLTGAGASLGGPAGAALSRPRSARRMNSTTPTRAGGQNPGPDDDTARTEDERRSERERRERDKRREEEQLREIHRLAQETHKLREELRAKTKKMDDVERAVKAEREAMKQERSAMQQDYMDLQTCLAEREQDIQQLGQIITAVQRGEIKVEHLKQLDLSGGLYSERSSNTAAPKPKKVEEPKSIYSSMPVEEVTWEVSLSSRPTKPRPAIVPPLNLSVCVPSVQQSFVSNANISDEDEDGADEGKNASDVYSARSGLLGSELSKETSMPSLPSFQKK